MRVLKPKGLAATAARLKVRAVTFFTFRRMGMEIFFLALSIVTAWICLSPVTHHTSWPTNHDNVNAKLRTEIYAHHIKQKDLVPVWSVSDGYGLGSPMPLYYQKTFYYLAGFVYLIVDDIKNALVWSIGIWLVIGAYGMRLAVRRISREPLLWLLVPQAFLFSNYVFTDWLVRGAAAEFSAMMLVPWLLWWCLRLIQDKVFSWTIVPIFVLLFGAHNAILMTSLLLPLGAFTVYLWGKGWREALRKTVVRGTVCIAAVGVILAPILIAQAKFNADYDPSTKIIQAGLTPIEQIHPLGTYFVDHHYVWLKNWSQLTVQVDYGAWIPVAIVLIGLGLLAYKKQWRKRYGKFANMPVLVFLLGTFAVYLLMQTKLSAPVYAVLPPLKLLQFPWRLLTFLTPLGLLVAVLLFDALYKKWPSRWLLGGVAALWLGSFLLLSPVFKQFHYPFYPLDYFDTQIAPNSPDASGMVQGGEYVPTIYMANGKERGQIYSYDLYNNMHAEKRLNGAVDGTLCTLIRRPDASFESLTMHFNLVCQKPTTYALPLSYSRYMRLYDITGGKHTPIAFQHDKHDPRVLVQANTRPIEILVQVPTLTHVLFGKPVQNGR